MLFFLGGLGVHCLFAFGYGLGIRWWCDDVEVFIVVFFGLCRSSVYICVCLVSLVSLSCRLGNVGIPSTSLIRGVLVLLFTCSTGAASVVEVTGGESVEVILSPFSNFDSHSTRIF